MIKGLEWWPVDKVTTNPTGTYFKALRDHWWIFNEFGQVAVYRSPWGGSVLPQCNPHWSVAERMRAEYDGRDVRMIPLAFIPIRLEDYR